MKQLTEHFPTCPVHHMDCTMAECEVSVKSEPVWQDSEVNKEPCGQTSFEFAAVPESCPQLEVVVKVERPESKTEPVSPPPTQTADTANSDADDDLPLSCVETVMAVGEARNGFSAERNQAVEATKTKHNRILKDKPEKMLECNICERKFKVKGALNEHLRTHTGDKPYQCNICNYKFTKKINLDIHLRTHTGEKPFECVVCKRKFSEAVNLKRHIRTHTGEKPYECDVCKRRFNEAVNLKRHERTHTGEKPFLCPYPSCENKFNQKVTLERHIRTHTGEKPYKCNFCNAKFLANSGLSRHLKTHYSEEHPGFITSAMKKYYAVHDEKPFK